MSEHVQPSEIAVLVTDASSVGRPPERIEPDARERELRLEIDAVATSRDRYRQSLASGPAVVGPGIGFVKRHFPKLAAAIRAEKQSALNLARLPKHALPLLAVDDDRQAVVTLHALLEFTRPLAGDEVKPPALTRVVKEVGSRCWMEWCGDKLRGRQRQKVAELIAERSCGRNRKRAIEQEAALDRPWAEDERDTHLGELLLGLAAEATCAFAIEQELLPGSNEDRKWRNVIVLTRSAREEIARDVERQEQWLTPVRRPMLVPPLPWKGVYGGGYLRNENSKDMVLVMKHRLRPHVIQALGQRKLGVTLAAVNALQDTAWRINERLYDVMNAAFGKEATCEGVAFREAACELWETKKKGTAEKEVDKLRFKLGACVGLVGEPRLYFPHQLDYRGRAYCVPPTLSPQADDAARALLEFADGKALGKRGVYWLRVHLANTYGHGHQRKSLTHRVHWVKAQEGMILGFARDPLESLDWLKARKPWSFLAACFEWKRYRAEGQQFISHVPVSVDGSCNAFQHISALTRDRDGGHKTNLVPSDTPADIYEGVATRVQESIRETAKCGGPPAALAWATNLELIDRKLVKGPTMTMPYGATVHGIREQIGKSAVAPKVLDSAMGPLQTEVTQMLKTCIDKHLHTAGEVKAHLREQLESKSIAPGLRVGIDTLVKESLKTSIETLEIPDEPAKLRAWLEKEVAGRKENKKYSNFVWAVRLRAVSSLEWCIAKAVQPCVDAELPVAVELKKWLIEITNSLAGTDHGVYWTAPSGFPVITEERKLRKRAVTITLKSKPMGNKTNKRKLILYEFDGKNDIRRGRQRNRIVANFVHSLDAAHMAMTISALSEQGIKHLTAVHDSFGTHAADMDQLNRVLREQFVVIYRRNLLKQFLKEQQRRVPEADWSEVSPFPLNGLKIGEVLNSEYFFA